MKLQTAARLFGEEQPRRIRPAISLLAGLINPKTRRALSDRQLRYVAATVLPLVAVVRDRPLTPERRREVHAIALAHGNGEWLSLRRALFTEDDWRHLRQWLCARAQLFIWSLHKDYSVNESELLLLTNAAAVVASVLVTPEDINNLPALDAGFCRD